MSSTGTELHYDVVVVGSGFGGSVAALRLTEKGYRVGVLEAGRRFSRETLPRNSWDLKNFLWAPRLGLYGIQRIHLLRNVLILAGAGVGGGSLNYANTLYEPLGEFYADPQWSGITDWRAELAPYYDLARRMLGARTNPAVTPADMHLRKIAGDLGVEHTFRLTPVGVYFGDGTDGADPPDRRLEPGEDAGDPYFGGAGPARRACLQCGECMTGCRHGAKNMLTENYLYFAERSGAVIHPLTTAVRVRDLGQGGGFAVDTVGTDARRRRRTFTADQVVLAAGTYGTQHLLHAMRDDRVLLRLSPRLGALTRTNSEALVGAVTRAVRPTEDFTRGVAITSSIHPNEHTHIEPVRYGRGSNAMGLLTTIAVPGGGRVPRWIRFFGRAARHPATFARSFSVRNWSQRTFIGLVMQSLDNSLTTYTRRRLLGGRRLTSRQGYGAPNPTWIPEGQDFAERVAAEIDGVAGGTLGDIVNVPMTAHFLGGCPIGDSPETGVVDPYHRLYGYPGIHVVDGSAVSANLGVNPALTITAQAERAMSMWPNNGEPDPRPAQGSTYLRVPAVSPHQPAIPAGAHAELRP